MASVLGKTHALCIAICFLLSSINTISSGRISNTHDACEFSVSQLLQMDPIDARDVLLYLHHDLCIEGDNTVDIIDWEFRHQHLFHDLKHTMMDQREAFPNLQSRRNQNKQHQSHVHPVEENLLDNDSSLLNSQYSTTNNEATNLNLSATRSRDGFYALEQRSILTNLYDVLNGDAWLENDGWLMDDVPICSWFGVSCYESCSETQRQNDTCPIVGFNLPTNNLMGDFGKVSEILHDLPNIVSLNFNTNELVGTIQDLQLPMMTSLNLYMNRINGTIPDFSGMPMLEHFEIDDNPIEGELFDFSFLPNLKIMYIGVSVGIKGHLVDYERLPLLNRLHIFATSIEGTIPAFLNLQYLEILSLYSNQLSGSIPDFSALRVLQECVLFNNDLSGTIPNLSNLRNLRQLDLDNNKLTGTIPDFINLTRLQELYLYSNQLNGQIPDFANSARLQILWVSNNKLTGTIPDFQNLTDLRKIVFYSNEFSGTLPNFPSLNYLLILSLSSNKITGTIPDFNLASLQELWIYGNQFSGQIPAFIRCPNLVKMVFYNNNLTGTLPEFDIPRLLTVDLNSNRISGTIPYSLGGAQMKFMDLSKNQLNGSLPRSFENFASVEFMYLSNNRLEGTIPAGFWNLPKLFLVDLSHNRFCEELTPFISPTHDDYTYYYRYLNLEGNQLFGNLGDWVFMTSAQINELNLKNNSLTGLDELPISRFWKRLDLSHNPIQTPIPESYKLFTQMDYFGLRNAKASHQNNTLIPGFTDPVDPYNLRDRLDLFICPTIRATNSSSQTEFDIDVEYYGIGLCQCLPNYFGFAGRCVICPSECECIDGLSLRNCHASPSVSKIEAIIICPQPSSCIMEVPKVEKSAVQLPFVDQVCDVGYKGRGCSQCEQDYGRQGRGCVECGEAVVAISFIAGTCFIVGFVVFIYKWSTSGSGTFRILTFHMQTLSILSSVWATSRRMDNVIEWSYTIGSMQMPNLSCVLKSTNLEDTVLFSIMRLPIVMTIILLLCFLLPKYRDKIIYVGLNVLLLFSYNIARDVFGVFGCTVYDDGDNKWYLNVAPWITCDPMSGEMKRLLGMAIPVFISFVLSLPLGLYYLLKKRNPQDESDTQRIGFLYLAYKEECWFWELVIMTRRLLFSFVISVLPYTQPEVLFFSLVVIIQGSIWMQHRYQPYNIQLENRMETISLYVIFTSFILALLANMFDSEVWMTALIISINVVTLSYFVLVAFVIPMLPEKSLQMEITEIKISSDINDSACSIHSEWKINDKDTDDSSSKSIAL